MCSGNWKNLGLAEYKMILLIWLKCYSPLQANVSFPTVKETGFRIQAQRAVTIHKMY